MEYHGLDLDFVSIFVGCVVETLPKVFAAYTDPLRQHKQVHEKTHIRRG